MALRGQIPRALQSHRTPKGYAYGEYLRAKVRRLGPLPADARPWLREAGLLTLALTELHREEEAARPLLTAPGVGNRKRTKVRVMLRQLERRAARLRASLEAAEKRLEALATRNGQGQDLARANAAIRFEASLLRGRPTGGGAIPCG
jgi:hypothetical protein